MMSDKCIKMFSPWENSLNFYIEKKLWYVSTIWDLESYTDFSSGPRKLKLDLKKLNVI